VYLTFKSLYQHNTALTNQQESPAPLLVSFATLIFWKNDMNLKFFTVAAVSLLTAACFQPMYATRTSMNANGAMVQSGPRAGLASVDVKELDTRAGQVVRNELLFQFNGGAAPTSPKEYTLRIAMRESAESAVVDPYTDRPEVETLALDAGFTLTRTATGEQVLTGNAFGRASYNRTRQRYATVRAQRDAEDRAAKVIAGQISGRIASYFAVVN
jgi:LPS-assembly lipoprotein